MLFDASEFIKPDAITKSLNEVRSFNFQSPALQQPQKPQQPAQPQFQQQQDNSAQEGAGVLSTIGSILAFL